MVDSAQPAHRRRRISLALGGLLCCVTLVGCGGDGAPSASESESPRATEAPGAPPGESVTAANAPAFESRLDSGDAQGTPSVSESTAASLAPETVAASISDEELRSLLVTRDDLLRAGDFPKGPFDEQVTVVSEKQSYATFTTVKPAACADFVQGPFAGTAPDPVGPIIGSGTGYFREGEVASVPGSPISVIETVQVFESSAAAEQAFALIAESAPGCRATSYDDGAGVLERSWRDLFVTRDGMNPIYQDTVVMFDSRTLRAIGLDKDRIWGLSLVSERALESPELDRFEDLMQLARSRVQGGLG